MTHTLTIPNYLPQPHNVLVRMHWAKRKKEMDECKALVAAYALAQAIPKATGKRRVTVKLVLGRRNKVRDGDSSFKLILDSCTADGLLIDDGPRWCELMPLVQERGRERATIIILEDL